MAIVHLPALYHCSRQPWQIQELHGSITAIWNAIVNILCLVVIGFPYAPCDNRKLGRRWQQFTILNMRFHCKNVCFSLNCLLWACGIPTQFVSYFLFIPLDGAVHQPSWCDVGRIPAEIPRRGNSGDHGKQKEVRTRNTLHLDLDVMEMSLSHTSNTRGSVMSTFQHI